MPDVAICPYFPHQIPTFALFLFKSWQEIAFKIYLYLWPLPLLLCGCNSLTA